MPRQRTQRAIDIVEEAVYAPVVNRILIALPYSPWSERARWALLHHRLLFVERAYLPMLGEPWLRLKSGSLWTKASVPLLLADGRPISDSVDIVKHADRHGSEAPLYPETLEDDLRSVSEQLEPVFHAGRARGIAELLKHEDLARSMLPRALRKMPLAAATSRLGSRYVARKYSVAFDDPIPELRRGLVHIRKHLGGRDYAFGDLSYADILFATALQLVSPVAGDYIRIGSAVRKHWRIPELEEEFSDLVEWRDRIYARHRPTSAR